MAKFSCPAKFIAIVRQFHDGMKARVQDGSEYSEPFLVTNGVKQGCVLTPTLFSMVFSTMLSDAFRDGDIGVSFRYHTDGSLFNLRRLQAKTKVHEDTARDFLLADDCALNASRESDMQESMDLFAKACDNFGLTISTKKIEVMHQPAPAAPYTEPNITINSQRLTVDKFVYPDSTLSRSINIDKEVAYRLARASAAFGRLTDQVWERRGLRLETKLKVYRAVVIPSLLYASETWTVYSWRAKQLNAFHMRCLRTLLRIRWQDKVPDTEVLQRAESESIHAILLHSQLRWADHVQRMDDSRLPKRLLYGELTAGQRSLGRPKKRYKDSLKESLKRCDIPYSTWEASANDCPAWCSLVSAGVLAFEANCIHEKDQIRQRRNERSSNPKPVQPPESPARIATDTFARRLGSSAISAPTLLPSDMKSWSSLPAKDEHHHHHH